MADITGMLQAAAGNAGEDVDPDFANTVLLLHGDGTNGAQNNTFLDSSTNNFTITRAGNTTQGTFTPFSKPDGRWGNYFGSNTANLKFASNAAFAIGTGNFTVECFVNFDAWASTNQRILMQDVSGGSNLQIGRDSGANNLFVVITGSTVINYSWSPTVGEFYHIAVVRSGTGTNEVALYIDGVSVATGTSNGSISQQQVIVGGLDWATGYNIQGYISNFRYSNVARTITVPTAPYTSDANTLILTCQSNRFLDNSSNAFAVTVNGTVKVTPFSPFPITTEYTPSVNGGSGYFDGSGDYLSSSSTTALGSGDFTIDVWFYATATMFFGTLFNTDAAGSSSFSGIRLVTGNNNNTLSVAVGNAAIINASSNFNQFSWNHASVVRSGSTITLYQNGVSVGTATNTTNFSLTDYRIGDFGGGFNWNGYLANLRVVVGSAITPPSGGPTSQLTAVSGTSYLTNFSNAGIFDNTNFNVLESVGNSQINTTTKVFGTGSLSFDGTGDYLKAAFGNNFDFGTGPFTVEFWLYLNATTNQCFLDLRTGSPFLFDYSSDALRYFANSTVITGSALSTGQWYHIALTRDSSSDNRMFVDGTQTGSTVSNSTNLTGTTIAYIGANYTGGDALNGYIDDLRITKGVARYTTTFTPPTAAFPNIGE